ncbi:unnamed protein product [Clonostachys rosea]|uniref:Uncharacterized protein n=1 Tax=Bionectria ochroleuca TaxID=29856 RepID=A0ABY6UYQ4_BIOOC|nr:unnamed protein product [Clonostachys rosea]
MASETPQAALETGAPTRQDAAPAVAETTIVPHWRWYVVDEANHNPKSEDWQGIPRPGRRVPSRQVLGRRLLCKTQTLVDVCFTDPAVPIHPRKGPVAAAEHPAENSTPGGLDGKFPASWRPKRVTRLETGAPMKSVSATGWLEAAEIGPVQRVTVKGSTME